MGPGGSMIGGEMSDAAHHIFYDGTCELCRRSRAWLERRDARGAFAFIDSRDPVAMARWPEVSAVETVGRMVVRSPDGKQQGGYDGVVALLRAIPRWRVVAPLLAAWGVRSVGRLVYRAVARNRYRLMGRAACEGSTCRV